MVEAAWLGGWGVEEGSYQALDGGGDLFGGGVVGGADPLAGCSVDGPGGGGGEEFGGGWGGFGGRVFVDAFEEHGADDGDDGRLHVRGEVCGGGTSGGGGLGEGLGEEVADAKDDAGEGGAASTVE